MKILKTLIVISSLGAIGVVGFGMHEAVHSPLFQVEAVEVNSSSASPPLDEGEILALASVPVGRVSLFELDLRAIQDRLLANDWIREVSLEKRFPHTLVMGVKFRDPYAVIQTRRGSLAYVDSFGTVFGNVTLKQNRDLPLFTGFTYFDAAGLNDSDKMPSRSQNRIQERIKDALHILSKWQLARLDEVSLISSVQWESDRGFRILVSYPLGGLVSGVVPDPKTQARAVIELGSEIEPSLEEKFLRLSNVLRYLSKNSIVVRQIRADVGKKVVVKTVHGS